MAKDTSAKAATAPEAAEAEKQRLADELAAKDSATTPPEQDSDEDMVEVKNAGERNVHTSRGKLEKDATLSLPEPEAAALVKKGLVKTV